MEREKSSLDEIPPLCEPYLNVVGVSGYIRVPRASLSSDVYQSCFHVARDTASCSLSFMRSYTYGASSETTMLSIIRTAHILTGYETRFLDAQLIESD